MPQDAEVRQLLLEFLAELKSAVSEHDKRIRKLEVTVARYVGGLGVLTFLMGGALALWRR